METPQLSCPGDRWGLGFRMAWLFLLPLLSCLQGICGMALVGCCPPPILGYQQMSPSFSMFLRLGLAPSPLSS